MLACTLLIAVALSAVADAQLTIVSTPATVFIVMGGSDAVPTQLITSNYTVTIGSNVTLGCSYNQTMNQNWWTTIGKYSTDGKVVLPLVENGFGTDAFVNAYTQYPAIDARIDGSAYFGPTQTITYLKLINVQPYDLGAYACYSRFSNKQRTAYFNLTLSANTGDLYGVRAIAIDQQLEVQPNSTTSTYSCSVYRAPNSQLNYFAYFDKCSWSGRGEDTGASRTTTCINKPSVWSIASNSQVTYGVVNITARASETLNSDMYPLTGEFAGNIIWQKSVTRDTYTLSLTVKDIYANWLNQSLGCFAYLNSTRSYFSDYMTFVAPGVDLNLDPTLFACGRHHFVATSGTVNFTCVVTQPSYRTATAYVWELWIPTKANPNLFNSVTIATQADLDKLGYGTNVKLTQSAVTTTVSVSSLATPQQQTRTTLSVQAGTDQSKWRYRLVAQYPDGSAQQSDYFSIATSVGTGVGGSGALPGPQAGKVSGANALTAWSMLLSVSTAVAFLIARV